MSVSSGPKLAKASEYFGTPAALKSKSDQTQSKQMIEYRTQSILPRYRQHTEYKILLITRPYAGVQTIPQHSLRRWPTRLSISSSKSCVWRTFGNVTLLWSKTIVFSQPWIIITLARIHIDVGPLKSVAVVHGIQSEGRLPIP